ncbi:hypothetical protein [Streptomyces sp. MBT27]|uniref:hypothetical protein n=1 Tax=Streptomyces sp. MBT27 TaxID=1488356 RepID=UPI00141D8A74|nr:hypothetical protein [Streptomyces sp. MBT27]
MDFRISGGSREFELDLLALIDKHLGAGDLTVEPDPDWTPERAETFWRIATPPARILLHAVIERDGFVSADTLRDQQRNLKSLSGSITATVTRGWRDGVWPKDIKSPVVPEYDPRNPSWAQVQGYRMPADLVALFRAADEKRGEEFKSLMGSRS